MIVMNVLKKIIVFCLVLFALFSPSWVMAHSIEYESVNPKDGFNYGLKRFEEKVRLFWTFSKSKKSGYYLKLSDARLAELKFTVDQKDMANFETSTTRYFSTIGQYVEFLKNKKVSYNKDEIQAKFADHTEILQVLRDKFDSEAAEWRFLQDDINYLDNYLSSL